MLQVLLTLSAAIIGGAVGIRSIWSIVPMLRGKRWMLMVPRVLRATAKPQSTAVAPLLDEKAPLEEEKTPHYSTQSFYPARLGEILADRYQIATKVGYGSSSTVWLARDLLRLVLQALLLGRRILTKI